MSRPSTKHKRVTQMGNLIHAGESYHRMVEIVQSGVLGPIRLARVWMAGGSHSLGKPADTAPPEGCDYDFWLGPAPKRPFNPNRFHFTWRYFWDYAGGQLGDFICHLVDPVHWAMNVKAPAMITASGQRYADDNAETPDALEVVYHYNEGFDLIWSHQNHSPRGFFDRGAGIAFYGTKATLHGHYSDYKIVPNGNAEITEPPKTLPRSVGHHREWLDAIKTRAQCSCHFGYGHELSALAHLGNLALRTGTTLAWDGAAERVTNHPAANAHLFREEYRKPWVLPEV